MSTLAGLQRPFAAQPVEFGVDRRGERGVADRGQLPVEHPTAADALVQAQDVAVAATDGPVGLVLTEVFECCEAPALQVGAQPIRGELPGVGDQFLLAAVEHLDHRVTARSGQQPQMIMGQDTLCCGR